VDHEGAGANPPAVSLASSLQSQAWSNLPGMILSCSTGCSSRQPRS
jgi:hypothetical protein